MTERSPEDHSVNITNHAESEIIEPEVTAPLSGKGYILYRSNAYLNIKYVLLISISKRMFDRFMRFLF